MAQAGWNDDEKNKVGNLVGLSLKEQLSYFAKKKIFNVKEAEPQDLLAFFYFMNLTGLGS